MQEIQKGSDASICLGWDKDGSLQLHLKYSQRFSPTFLINNKNAYQVLIRSCQSLKYFTFYIELDEIVYNIQIIGLFRT